MKQPEIQILTVNPNTDIMDALKLNFQSNDGYSRNWSKEWNKYSKFNLNKFSMNNDRLAMNH